MTPPRIVELSLLDSMQAQLSKELDEQVHRDPVVCAVAIITDETRNWELKGLCSYEFAALSGIKLV